MPQRKDWALLFGAHRTPRGAVGLVLFAQLINLLDVLMKCKKFL